jgi:chaperonin cofactor prefoldin
MGLFWDLIQQSQISDQRSRAESLEQRVYDLEVQLDDTRRLLHQLVSTLEQHFGQDIDGDGRIG